MSDIAITVTRSDGADGAAVVFIDTQFEPTGNTPGLRIVVNDEPVFEGKSFRPGSVSAAGEVQFEIKLDEIAYES